MTVEEFEQQMSDFGQQLSRIDGILLAAGGRLVDQMKASAPVDTGALRNSIEAIVQDNTLTLGMLSYGLYQNFGVKGTEDNLGVVVPEGIFPGPREGNKYSFRTRRFGLPAQDFFDMQQLTDSLIEAIEENIINNN